MKFRTRILESGKTATGIQVPDEIVAALGPSQRPAVRVTLNGYTYRSTVATMGGKFMVGVSAEARERARVAGGEVVDVDVALDTEPREVVVPPDFARALAKEAKAKRLFDGLSYSNRRRFVLAIEGARAEETRQRRIAKAVADLKAGKK